MHLELRVVSWHRFCFVDRGVIWAGAWTVSDTRIPQSRLAFPVLSEWGIIIIDISFTAVISILIIFILILFLIILILICRVGVGGAS